MRFVWIFLLIVAGVAPRIWGQEDVQRQLYQFALLERQGQFASALQGLQPLAGSSVLSRIDQGRAWTLLGYAYKETGQFQLAQAAFEKALNALQGDTQHLADLGNALDFFAAFYQTIGQPQAAGKMWSKALDIFQQEKDHRSMAKTYANLAAVALEQKHIRKAKTLFSRAEAEMTSDLTDDDRAFISDIQGCIDDKTKHTPEAVDDYERALEFWKKGHGDEHPFTGWRYLLLGNAYAANGNLDQAVTTMHHGLTIMDRTAGSQNPRYLSGEIMYARILKKYGKRAEAAQLKAEAIQQLSEIYHSQCIGCTVSTWSLR